MKKKISYLLILLMAVMSACQRAIIVPSEASGVALGSLTAKFTTGPYAGQEAVKLTITDSSTNDFVIPIPWYYPESSSNTTEAYLSAMKLEASLVNNVSISPDLGIVDLNKKNNYKLTMPDGTVRAITIAGAMTKSNKSVLTFFSISSLGVTGLIDQDKKTVSLITVDDLSNVDVEVSVSPHASVVESLAGINLNEPTTITVVAQDGITKTAYQVFKSLPAKITYGFRSGSQVQNFNLKLDDLGLTNALHPSLAASGNFVAVSVGDGSAPKYYNRSTGKYAGVMNMGSSAAGNGSIASDSKGNILILDQANTGGIVKMFLSNSMVSTPTSYISWSNSSGYPIGGKLSVNGDLNENAVIIATCEATSSAASKSYVRWVVSNGNIGSPEVIVAGGIPYWGDGVNGTKVTSRSTSAGDGSFTGFYDGGNDNLYYLNGNGAKTLTLGAQTSGNAWGINNSLADAKEFNNAKYLAFYCPSHFPNWGINSELYIYDVTSMGNFTGTVDATKALAFSTTYGPLGSMVAAAGDVLIAPTLDGYKMQVFTIDFNVGNFACYEFDCVER